MAKVFCELMMSMRGRKHPCGAFQALLQLGSVAKSDRGTLQGIELETVAQIIISNAASLSGASVAEADHPTEHSLSDRCQNGRRSSCLVTTGTRRRWLPHSRTYNAVK